jgi:hypothetical protein
MDGQAVHGDGKRGAVPIAAVCAFAAFAAAEAARAAGQATVDSDLCRDGPLTAGGLRRRGQAWLP